MGVILVIKLKDVNNYEDLIKLKNKNTKIKSKSNLYIFLVLALAGILSFYVGAFLILSNWLFIFFFKVIYYLSICSHYKKYYYEKFYPELLEYIGIHDLMYIKDADGKKIIKKSGLNRLTSGGILSITCFHKSSNEFNYFGYYKQTQGNEHHSETTFDGYFFIKETKDPLPFNLTIKCFGFSNTNLLNEKYFSGSVTLNGRDVKLSENCIKLLADLEQRFGRAFIVVNENCIAVQFHKLGTDSNYELMPYLENGVDTEDHFRIIELSNLEKEFSSIVDELLGEIQFLK